MVDRVELFARRVLSLPRRVKHSVAIVVDAALCVASVAMAFYLRLGEWIVPVDLQWAAVILALSLALPIFVAAGLYRTIFRYSDPVAIVTISQAVLVYGICYALVITFVQIPTIPRTVGIIQPAILFLFVATSRIVVGWLLGGASRQAGSEAPHPVIIYGAGSAGRQLMRGLRGSQLSVVGFVDDDEQLQGRTLLGRQIFPPAKIEELVARFKLTHILLAIPSASRRRRNEILAEIRPLKVKVQTLPALADVAEGKIRTSELRDLDIDDLLGREAVAPDPELLRSKIAGKVVLVTGAGGSIGSELCRQILASGPKTLLLVETSEAALYTIHEELALQPTRSPTEIVPLLCSVVNRARMRSIMAAWSPDTLYHAAAYKHVPLVEYNPLEGIFNNVLGTFTTAEICRENGVADFVLVSTDKAVRPTNVMGASKRLAELALQAIASRCDTTRFSMVRFGNVLDSSGSVVPLFRRQLAAGGPLTVTHEDVTRYFMTIPEAAQLVIQAGAMARGGEVFVLDMGEPVPIMDLARRMVELSGLKVHEPGSSEGDIEIAIVGLRPGEKLFEELLIGNSPQPTIHPRVMMANETFLPLETIERQMARLRELIGNGDVVETLRLLKELVPDYTPEPNLADLVHLRRKTG